MTKMFVLYRRQYGDFDIAYDVPVAASNIKEHLKIEEAHLTSKLKQEELDREVHYWVSSKPELRIL